MWCGIIIYTVIPSLLCRRNPNNLTMSQGIGVASPIIVGSYCLGGQVALCVFRPFSRGANLGLPSIT